MKSKVAVVDTNASGVGFREAIRRVGGVDDLNQSERSVVVKVGVWSPRLPQYTTVDVVRDIIDIFGKAPRIYLAESDNYCGKALDRLQVWAKLFSDRVVPFDLTRDTNARKVKLAGLEMELSNILFKPNVFVDTHVMRTFARGSVLKNLFGCTRDAKKAKYHVSKIFFPMLADIFENTGGIDLAVLDGTHLFRGGYPISKQMNTLIVGRDAVAVEAVGLYLVGFEPNRNPLIQEFVRRRLGVGDLKDIEVMGPPLEELKQRFSEAVSELEGEFRAAGGAPKSWAPAIDRLIEDGFFNKVHKRTKQEVMAALAKDSIKTDGKAGIISTTLERRVKSGALKKERVGDESFYWT